MEIKWFADCVPLKDGDYLTATGIVLSGKLEITSIGNLHYVADKEGGWNCHRSVTGKISNEYRLDNVVAWSDCIDDLFNEVKEEVKKWNS